VATVAEPQAGFWTVPIRKESAATEDDVRPYPLQVVRALAPRIHGNQLFYLSSVGGEDGLWRHADGRSQEIWKGSDAPLVAPAAISPNGKRIALVAREDGRARLYVINADGTEPRRLMDDVLVAGAPCWSPDGEWLVVGGSKGGNKGLFKVEAGGGQSQGIHTGDAMNPVWSPDGNMIVFAGAESGPDTPLHAVDPDGRELDALPENLRVPGLGERVRFLPDGSGLVYMQGVDPHYNFHLLDLGTGMSTPLTNLTTSATMRTFDITPDGKTIVFDRERQNSNIVLIERELTK